MGRMEEREVEVITIEQWVGIVVLFIEAYKQEDLRTQMLKGLSRT